MVDKIEKDARDRMHKTLETLKREFATIRTGKASPHLLDTVSVEAYGTHMPLNQVATITAPEPRLIVVTAFDKSTVGNIAKGIQAADLGLNPLVDGQVIRVPVPALNEERRKTLVKQCHKLAEEGRVAIRNIRRDANEHLKKSEHESEISEDDMNKGLEKIQKMTDEHIKQVNDLLGVKEKEVLEV